MNSARFPVPTKARNGVGPGTCPGIRRLKRAKNWAHQIPVKEPGRQGGVRSVSCRGAQRDLAGFKVWEGSQGRCPSPWVGRTRSYRYCRPSYGRGSLPPPSFEMALVGAPALSGKLWVNVGNRAEKAASPNSPSHPGLDPSSQPLCPPLPPLCCSPCSPANE